MAVNPLEQLQHTAKDALYVSVGLGVIAFQKAQVRRQELRSQLQDRAKTVEERIEGVGAQLRTLLGT